MFFKKKKSQKEAFTDYREFLSKPENRTAVYNISQELLAEIAPEESELTASFIKPLIEMAADGAVLTVDSLDEAGGFGGADLMVVVAVQVAIVVISKLATRLGETDAVGLKRRLWSEENPETLIRIETGDVKVAITSTQSSQGKKKARQIIEAINLILSAYLLEDTEIEIEEPQNDLESPAGGLSKSPPEISATSKSPTPHSEGTSEMKRIALSHDDKQRLITELNKLPQWQTGGVSGERAVLLAAGLPQNTVYAFSLTGVPATDSTNIIAHLENLGRLPDRPTHTALGALVEYQLNNIPDQEGQSFLAGLIVRYRMIDDEAYLAELRRQYSVVESTRPASLEDAVGKKGTTPDLLGIEKSTQPGPGQGGVTIGYIGGNIDGSTIIGEIRNEVEIDRLIYVEREPGVKEGRSRHNVLKRMKEFWATNVSGKSLQSTDLVIEMCPEAIDNPWEMVVDTSDQIRIRRPLGTRLFDVFDEVKKSLLILGEPGIGKTTLLLELGRLAIANAEQDTTQPIPVILSLIWWTPGQQSLTDWVVNVLQDKFYFKRETIRHWLEYDELFLLFDDLDKVKPVKQREACVKAINQFHQEHSLIPFVVCCRTADYKELNTHLQLHGAVCLHSGDS